MGAKRQEWASRVQQWRQSGQTARDFARARGFNHNTLTHWAWRLGAGKRLPARSPARKQSPAREGRPGKQAAFIEIMSQTIADGRFELELAGGRVLRIPPRFDAESLVQLVRVLEAER